MGAHASQEQRVVQGTLLKDNGFKSALSTRLLSTADMCVYEWVDRMQCGEYQLLAEICNKLEASADLRNATSRRAVSGFLQIYVLSPPCLSCMSLFRQFQ